MVPHTSIPRRSLVIFIILSVLFIAQMTWWIIFHVTSSQAAIEEMEEAYAVKSEGIAGILNNQYQMLFERAKKYMESDSLEALLSSPMVSGYSRSTDEIPIDSLSLIVQSGSKRILLFLNKEYPSRLINGNDKIHFVPVANGMFRNPRWVKTSNIAVDVSGLKEIEEDNRRHTRMLLMEGSFFFFLILVGLWMIYSSIRKKRQAAEEQTLFIHSITHELKIPITSVNLFLDTIKRREYDPEMTRELFPKMKEDLRRLNGLIDNILNIRKLSEKRAKVLPKIDFSSEITAFSERIKEKVETAGGRIETEIEDGLYIRARSEELQRVWDTLVDNSIKYAHAKDLKIRILLKRSGHRAVFEIIDNGRGIDPETMEHVFDKFYRGDDKDTRAVPGSGLGLYIAREYIERNGGEIEIGNATGGGCRVTMRFETVS